MKGKYFIDIVFDDTEAGVSKKIIQKKFDQLLSNKKPVSFKTDFNSSSVSELNIIKLHNLYNYC